MRKTMRILTTLAVILTITILVVPAPSFADEVATERVVIQFKPGHKTALMQATSIQNAQRHYEFDELNAVVVTLPVGEIDKLRSNPSVLSIEKDARRYPADQTIPYGVEKVEARDTWDANHDGLIDPGAPTGAGRTVCIIDSGVDADHPDLVGVNFVGGYPSDWNIDNYGHGTHVAGTIAAVNNAEGVVGVTPGTVSLYIVKVFGDTGSWTYSSTLVDAAYRCRDAGANVISMSLTGSYESSYEDNAFQTLYNQGLLLVAAAGNGGGTDYGYPASYDSVISVAAVNESNVVASFSRRNDQVELAAPGVGVYSTYKNGTYAYMSGTSMATPHVAAAAALVWSADPAKTNQQIRSAFQQTALDLGAPGRDNEYGYGLVKAKCACALLNPVPTSVELVSFEAALRNAAIQLTWETASEADSLGFNVYRAESVDGPRVQLNDSLIASQAPGSPVGASYQFVDETAEPGISYYYWLEALDVQGDSTFHGPVAAELLPMQRLLPVRARLAPAAPVIGNR